MSNPFVDPTESPDTILSTAQLYSLKDLKDSLPGWVFLTMS